MGATIHLRLPEDAPRDTLTLTLVVTFDLPAASAYHATVLPHRQHVPAIPWSDVVLKGRNQLVGQDEPEPTGEVGCSPRRERDLGPDQY